MSSLINRHSSRQPSLVGFMEDCKKTAKKWLVIVAGKLNNKTRHWKRRTQIRFLVVCALSFLLLLALSILWPVPPVPPAPVQQQRTVNKK